MTGQLVLNLPVRVDFSADSFVEGRANAAAIAALSKWQDWPRAVMALVGPGGSGKSHLAAIWARQTGAGITDAAGLEACLATLLSGQCLLVEDVDGGVADDALFHAINRAAEGDIPALLLTGRTLPALWKASLPDLVSRLRALPHADLSEPDDELLTRLLQKQFRDRGAPLRPGVIEYLLPRMERSVSAIRILVDRMDKLALAKQTPVTRSIARAALDELPEDGDPE
ncbi:HdaA/DnaA family protein [Maricaulis sp.]|uniref:HdaA/DnaA family protein n=1 Tax=Maricaulis sp. TaxID=1486257 RepID=UPI003A92FED7